jgi:hypothetical protein
VNKESHFLVKAKTEAATPNVMAHFAISVSRSTTVSHPFCIRRLKRETNDG